MHGYEMMSQMRVRSGGIWMPSPGAVYPALQMLADEGLIASETDGGRRSYTLTRAGRRVVERQEPGPPPWETMAPRPMDPADQALRDAGTRADTALDQVIATGTAEQKAAALQIMAATRQALYRLLAEDG